MGIKKKIYLIIASLFLPLISILSFMAIMFAGLGNLYPVEQEEASDYQVIGNQLNVNWEWILLINTYMAEKEGNEPKDQNPLYTALNCIKITIDVYTEEENDEGDKHWEYSYSDYANGAEEILSYFGLPLDIRDINLFTRTIERWDVQEEYQIKMEPYPDLEQVLNTYYHFTDEAVSEILDLEREHYFAEAYGFEPFSGSGGIFEGEINAQLPAVGLKIPLYYQYQEPWRGVKFGDGTISTSGCSITSIAMVFSYLKDKTIYPDEVALWAGNRYHTPGVGASHSIFPAAANNWGLHCTVLGTNMNNVVSALSDGKPVIASMKKGTFTKRGHFIVLRGITADGKILVNDPNDNTSKQFFNKSFDVSLIKREAKGFWSFE